MYKFKIVHSIFKDLNIRDVELNYIPREGEYLMNLLRDKDKSNTPVSIHHKICRVVHDISNKSIILYVE